MQLGIRMDQVKPERIAWRSRGRVARGKITVCDGDPGLGKSTMLMDWAARVSRGDPLPGGDPQPERGVLLICGEDDPSDTIQPRLDAMGADLSQITLLVELPVPGENGRPDSLRLLRLPDDVPLIEEMIVALSVGLVIIDPLFAFLNPELKSTSDQDVREALTPLATALQRTHASAILVRHLNKNASSNSLYRGSGSIGIIGVARFGMLVARARDDRDLRVLASTKQNIGAPAVSESYRLVPWEKNDDIALVKWEGPVHDSADDLLGDSLANDDQKNAQTAAEEFLTHYLRNNPAPRSAVIADAKKVGIGINAIDKAKTRLGIQHKRLGQHLGLKDSIYVWHLPGQDLSGIEWAS